MGDIQPRLNFTGARTPKETEEKMRKIEKIIEWKEFVKEFIDLIEHYPSEEWMTPTKYSEKTGEVVEKNWVKSGKFSGRINSTSWMYETLPLSLAIRQKLKEIEKSGKTFQVGDNYNVKGYVQDVGDRHGSEWVGGVEFTKVNSLPWQEEKE